MSGPRSTGHDRILALDAGLDLLAAEGVDDGQDLVRLAARLAALPVDAWDDVAPLYQPPRRPASAARRWVGRHGRPLLAAAAAAVLLGVLAGVVVPGGGRTPLRSAAGSWKLVGYIDQPAWNEGAAPGSLGGAVVVSCPVAGTCYADAPGGTAPAAVVEVTTDGGASWSASDLPAGAVALSGLSCPDARTCAAAATSAGGPAVLLTADGGATWAVRAVPPGVAAVTDVACVSPTSCVGIGRGPSAPGTPAPPPVAMRTTDAGVSWTLHPVPGPFAAGIGGLSCPDANHCVATGTSPGTPTAGGAARYSADGGTTWSVAVVPGGLSVVRGVSCANGSDCMALGDSPASEGSTQALASVDGGRSWTVSGPVLPGLVDLVSVSCSSAGDCVAAGHRQSPGSAPTGVIAATTDGGSSWSPVTLPTAGAAGSGLATLDVEGVTSVTCPAAGPCLAVGLRGTTAAAEKQVVLRAPG